MSRRRKKNPLLGRILLISVVAHVIALPILAQFGVFDKVKRGLQDATVMLIPTEKQDEQESQPNQQKKAAPKKSVSRAGAPHAANPNAPKVVTAGDAGGDSGDSGGPAVESGSGKAGVAPVPVPEAAPQPKPQPVAQPQPKPIPEKPVEQPQPKPIEQPKHTPVIVEAQQTFAPPPTIPDDLRQDALDKTFVAEFLVGPDGVPSEVKVAQSTGIKELDDVALGTARQWRFKPATVDGRGVESRVRLKIEFSVEML